MPFRVNAERRPSVTMVTDQRIGTDLHRSRLTDAFKTVKC